MSEHEKSDETLHALKSVSSGLKDYLEAIKLNKQSLESLKNGIEELSLTSMNDRRDTARKSDVVVRVILFFINIVLLVQVGVLAWMFTEIVDQGKYLAEIRANRFTVKDGIELERRLSEKFPPKEVLKRVDKLEDGQSRIERGGR